MGIPWAFKEAPMQPSIPEENVFGEHDGSTFSATLCHGPSGWYFSRCVVDEHNMRIDATWPTRDEAMEAVKLMASGDRKPD